MLPMKIFFTLLPFSVLIASASYLYLSSAYYVPPAGLIRPLLVSWGLLLAMEWPAYRITRSREWSSILLLIVVLAE
jgi:hypothetical protein